MINRFLRQMAAVTVLLAASCSAADFNEVGRQMAIALQNTHFKRIPFDRELSQRMLKGYFDDLDPQRLYFTRQDVDAFTAKYGDTLHELLLTRRGMEPAVEIYDTFVERVEARVALVEKLLRENSFDFTTDLTVERSRKKAAWPRDEEEAVELWRLQIREAVLSEMLRRDLLAKLAKEKGKPEPARNEREPTEKIALRYKRLLSAVKDVDLEDKATYFLNAVANTYDPHTDYMSAKQMDKFKDGMKNELVGIGALLQSEEDGATKIMGIVVGGPADRAGELKLKDRVVAVDPLNTGNPADMVDIMFMRIDKVVDLIRGAAGTKVGLKVEPAGALPGETRIYAIQREKVELKDEQATAQLIETLPTSDSPARRLGIITLPSFYADFDEGKVRSSVDVERLLNRLVREEIDGLILDLRNNGGGSLDEVRRMTGFFVERGPVVQVKNSRGRVEVKESDNRRAIYDGPMVVVTDRSSASASEIMAGALQDANRAVIVGESTFGKGTVQQPMNIGTMMPWLAEREGAGYIKLTIQQFYLPSGSSTQKDGVTPHIALPGLLDGLEIGEAYLDNVLPHDRIAPAPGFRPLDARALFLPHIKDSSRERVNASMDFGYIIEDVMETKKRVEENKVSLNKAVREKELADAEARRVERNKERRERFAKMAAADRKAMRFYKLTLDDVVAGAEVHEYDPAEESAEYMKRAKDETEELTDSPEWPSGLDPVKREAMMVLRDLVEHAEMAKMAGVLPSSRSKP